MQTLKFLTENLNKGNIKWASINDKYLTQYNLIEGSYFGLPVDIEFDNNNTYQQANIPLSLFFRNSYLKEDKWLPIEVEIPTNIVFETMSLDITIDDYYTIREFVVKNQKLLKLVSENKISSISFINQCQQPINVNNKLLTEMPIKKIKIKDWVIYLMFGDIQIYKSNGLPTRFLVTKNGNMESLYKNEDGQPMLFDSIFYLGQNEQKCYCTLRGISYWLFSDGTLKEIETNF